jgi:inorganic pyrophosphatase
MALFPRSVNPLPIETPFKPVIYTTEKTWENPHIVHPDTGHKGDNDPLDACEISSSVARTGEVKQVKVLGIFCLLDGGETDWKTIVIDIHDPVASMLNGIQDLEDRFPGLLGATRDWFRIYKVPDGKSANRFALRGEFKDKG